MIKFRFYFKGDICPQEIEKTENIILSFTGFTIAVYYKNFWNLFLLKKRSCFLLESESGATYIEYCSLQGAPTVVYCGIRWPWQPKRIRQSCDSYIGPWDLKSNPIG